jgi:hypothetical protein
VLFEMVLFFIVGLDIGCFEGKEQASLDESCLIGVFDVQHHVFFSFVAVFLKNLLLHFEILFVVGLRRVEVSSSIETYRLDIFLVDGVRALLGQCFVRLGQDGFNSYHVPNKIKV